MHEWSRRRHSPRILVPCGQSEGGAFTSDQKSNNQTTEIKARRCPGHLVARSTLRIFRAEAASERSGADRIIPEAGPEVRRLSAGGRWIRTIGPRSAATPLSDR
jgi:hypothetical protein